MIFILTTQLRDLEKIKEIDFKGGDGKFAGKLLIKSVAVSLIIKALIFVEKTNPTNS